jgi:hypothetical protein
MTLLSRRALFAGAVLAGMGVAASRPLAQTASVEIVVPTAPPAARVEVIPEIPVDRRDREFWQPGYWRWNGHAHDWVEGRYVARPRTGAIWMPGHWERRGTGWIYVDGRWS